ncbi:retrovirus-related pol polyprotein from transposon TNT 1-94, partial [Tanacetum coccineum]
MSMASEQLSSGPRLQCMTPATPSSGLVPNHPPLASLVPPSRHEWDLVFQLVFDEFFSPLATVASPIPVEEAPAPIEAMQEELHEFERLEVWELVPHPDKVMVITLKWIYKVKLDEFGGILKNKARLAPRAWYDLLSSFLLSQGFSKGMVDPTLVISRKGKDNVFQIEDINDGQNIIFLGLQISQSPRGIFLNQSNYVIESLKKYGMESCDLVDTPMAEKSKLDKNTQGKVIDPTHYRSMVGTLMYLTSSRPDLVYAVCMCARYQAHPTKNHLHVLKRIFQYLRGTVNRGLLYSKDSAIVLTDFTNADYAGYQDTRQSTFGSMQFLGDRLVSWSSKRQKSGA